MSAASRKNPKFTRLPKHVAIIMDGNGRWAGQRGLPRIAGHKQGMESVRAAVKTCSALGVGWLTLYAFSTENWRRPEGEVGFLMKLLEIYLRQELKELHKNGVRIRAIGGLKALPTAAQRELERAQAQTKKNTGLTLTLALNYGGRQEILDAVKKCMEQARKGSLKAKDLDVGAFGARLATGDAPDPDLIIRTSGEMRLSNFLLWQGAYAEVYFTKKFWPDFGRDDLIQALKDYARRERRFGDVKPREA